MHNDEFFMAQALVLAQHAYDCGEVPVGAVVVRDNEIIGEAFNQPIGLHDPSAHAEVLAIRRAAAKIQNYRMPGAWLYVTIEPCTMCLGTLIHARIEGVVFGAREPKAGVLESYPDLLASGRYNHQLQWRGGIMEEACTQVIQNFFKHRREEKSRKKKGE